MAGEISATGYNANEPPNQTPFSYLGLNIERMFLTGEPAWPVERTLLTTGALDALMKSRAGGHVRLETPQLVIPYQPSQVEPIRPTNPRAVGASIEASPELLADHPTPGVNARRVINATTMRQGKL